MIGLAGEDAPADFAVGGGEEDLRRLEMGPGLQLRCAGGFCCWSSSGELYDSEVEAGQERSVNLSGILIASPIDDVKYITTKC